MHITEISLYFVFFFTKVIYKLLCFCKGIETFKHGISPQGKGFIRIEMSQEQGTITCAITNSNYPKRANDKSGSGIGLEQVSKRLELIYPDRYTWDRGLNNDNTEYHSKIVVRSATA